MKFGTTGDGVNQNSPDAKSGNNRSLEDLITEQNKEQSQKAAESRAAEGEGTAAAANVANDSEQGTTHDVKDAAEGKAAGGDVDPSRTGPDVTQERIDQSANLTDIPKGGYNTSEYTQPTAEDLGVDVDGEKQDYQAELAVQDAANRGATAGDHQTTYTSHPILNLHLGPYQFANGTLVLNADQVDDFESLLATLPLSERRNVAKLDISKVNEIAETRLASATKQFDSSVGKESLAALQREFPKVGTKAIDAPMAHTNLGLMDQNQPVPAAAVILDSDDMKRDG